MPGIPRLPSFDSSIEFLHDPYRFISNHARHLKSEVFETRLLLASTICMTGSEAAKLFADENLFQRRGAAPEPIAATLFGKGGVQSLDGEAHLHRKSLFMDFMTMENVTSLKAYLKNWLDVYSTKWTSMDLVPLYEEFQEILTRSVCSWTGIELRENEIGKRTKELTHMFDSAGSIKKHFSSRSSRKSAEAWITDLVLKIRRGELQGLEGTPVFIISHFLDLNGKPLPAKVAAVEILNLLRPTVALSLYFVFAIHALHLHAESRQRLKAQEPGYLDHFVNEVRRFYPFFPAVTAKVRETFKWGRWEFKKNTRVMLDLYGINHDPEIWERPGEFNPQRFSQNFLHPFDFVPQGAGDHFADHRCPGEFFTIELMRAVVEFFVMDITYDVPEQELQIQMDKLPATPKSHMLISNVYRQNPFVELNA